jgi:putative tryptophan/tyrosine transport system substrate-binding protein
LGNTKDAIRLAGEGWRAGRNKTTNTYVIEIAFDPETGTMLCREPLGEVMRRRDFLKAIAGSAAAWPLAARAQDGERVRRIGMLTGLSGEDTETKARIAAFLQELQKFGWIEGQNLRVDIRAGAGNAASTRKYAAELVALRPDVLLATGATPVAMFLEVTQTVPIVFCVVVDPIGAGFVEKLSRPGSNATGFMMFDYSLAGKWVELLKQIAPDITQVAVLRDPLSPAAIGQFAVIQAVAPSLGLEVSAINVSDPRALDRAVAAFAREPNGGLIVAAGPATGVHRDLIIALAARHKLPAVHFDRIHVTSGGLVSYGSNLVAQFRQAAGYVDRILRGEKPANLPVQAPSKYELVINLKAAKALGITVSPALLARADEVIE